MRKRMLAGTMAGLMIAAALVAWGQQEGTAPPATRAAGRGGRGAEGRGAGGGGGDAEAQKAMEPRSDSSITTATLHPAAIPGAAGVGGAGLSPINYTAAAGYMPLKDEHDKLRANIFYVAYTVGGAGAPVSGGGGGAEAASAPATQRAADNNPTHGPASTMGMIGDEKRPLTFLFNGGPGAASAWLHIGGVGPRRIDIPEDGSAPKAPFKLVENNFSWLPATDLVFVDPVNTGYSRAATPELANEFFGVREDIASMGEFIRLYLTKNGRWGSPIYLAGESYGTTRAAGLANYLQERVGVSVSGVVLISTVLNFGMLMPSESNDVPYAMYLPSYAAVGWYHKKAGVGKKLEDWLRDAESYAVGDYSVALGKGGGLSADERGRVAARVAELTGLRKEYVLATNLRIDPERFEKELLRSPTGEGSLIIGRFDGRITGWPVDGAADSQDYDPSLTGFYTAYTSAFNDYVRRQLKYENDIAYEVLSNRVHPWNYGSGSGSGPGGGGVAAGTGYLYVGDNLRDALTHNPSMRLLVCSGRFDLATPYFATDYELSHMTLSPEIRKNIRVDYFTGGHMLYHVRAGLEKLYGDVTGFVAVK